MGRQCILFLFLAAAGFLFPTAALAVNCTVPISGNMSISSSCTFPNTVDGIDTGTGTNPNTAVLTISGGATLTVLATQTISVGSFVPGNGSIAIISGGQIKLGTPVWLVDADGDGWPAAATQYTQTTAPTNGRRKNLMLSLTQVDANESLGCGANGSSKGACVVCNNGGTENSLIGTDPNNECTASYTSCSGNNKIGPDGNCNGAGACNTGGLSSACQTGGTCETAGGCTAGSCNLVTFISYGTQGTGCTATHYVCDGAGACIAPTTTTSCLSNASYFNPVVQCSNQGYISCNDSWGSTTCGSGIHTNCSNTQTSRSGYCNTYVY